MKNICIIIYLIFSAGNAAAQQVTFQKTYGGVDEDFAQCVQQTVDGGYIITGYTKSFGAGDRDIYLIKTDFKGDTLWTKTFGGTGEDVGFSGQQTTDGGFIIAGFTRSFGAGGEDFCLVKTDVSGNILWTKVYGGTSLDEGRSVQQTMDGGYIVAGWTSSFGAGNYNVYLIKTDAIGDTLWTKTFGGNSADHADFVRQTTDGGYIISGWSYSFGVGRLYLIKTDSFGDTLWAKTFGGGGDYGYSVQQTVDGGYIVGGYTGNLGAGASDVYLLKTDSNGNYIWAKTFGGSVIEEGYSVQQTTDGGYIVAGRSFSFGTTTGDVYLIKTDSNGDTLWTKIYSATSNENAFSVQQTADGGYIIAGITYALGVNVQIYLIKTDSLGNSGCNQGNPPTIVTTPVTLGANASTPVSSGGVITNPTTLVGSGGNITTTLCTTVDISPLSFGEGSGVRFSPNPATSYFTITFPGIISKGTIEMYNVLGESIFKADVSNVSQKEIRLHDTAPGIYFVKVSNGEKQYTQKLVVK